MTILTEYIDNNLSTADLYRICTEEELKEFDLGYRLAFEGDETCLSD